jgi:ATP-dependent helicase/nuclease subunit B
VILGSLNEGTWPTPSEIDPWMSRPMRARFKLPPAQRAVGQSAHDIYLLCASGEVLLTRSQKVEGTPTIPSRWLVRLATLVGGHDKAWLQSMDVSAYYTEGKRLLDLADEMPALQSPKPKPPLHVRPRKLKVTAVDEWLTDPYRVYARNILRLKKLDELDQDPDAADFGNMVHKAMEQFVALYPSTLPEQPLQVLLACGREAFAEKMTFPAVASLWWPRFEAMAAWIIEQEQSRRARIKKIMAEVKGQWDFDVDGNLFTLITRIDRLEINNDNSITIADYKTGSVPSQADIKSGKKNQLLLEALIALHGNLEPPLAKPLSMQQLEYWKLSARQNSSAISKANLEHIPEALARLYSLIRIYDNPDQSYAPPKQSSTQNEEYNDYAHLTRRNEWGEA